MPRPADLRTVRAAIRRGQFQYRGDPSRLSDRELGRKAGYIRTHRDQPRITNAMTRGHERIERGTVRRTAEHGVQHLERTRVESGKSATTRPEQWRVGRQSFKRPNTATQRDFRANKTLSALSRIKGDTVRISAHGRYSYHGRGVSGPQVGWLDTLFSKESLEESIADNTRPDGTVDMEAVMEEAYTADTGYALDWEQVDSVAFMESPP